MYWGGPRVATFVALNLLGPEVHTQYRWRKQCQLQLAEGIRRQNIIKVGSIYRQAMESLGLHRVPVEISEDETAIIRKVCYDQKADTLVGFCGPVRLDHTCTAHYRVKVREEVTGYNNIVQAFDNNVIGSYGRIIVINPLNPNLPKIPILVMPTCNTFTHELVQDRTHEIMKLFIEHIEPVWGPLIGPASDGDSRRQKFFLNLSRQTEGNRFRPIPEDLGFAFTCLVDRDGTIRNNCDQDSIHNHKKLINHLDHHSRSIRMGRFLVHLNHVREVYDRYDFSQHHLLSTDIERDDKQNWRSAQRLSFSCVRQLMREISNYTNTGTITYLELVWMYVEIFHSEIASLYTRIKYAAAVTTFLCIWQNWIKITPQVKLEYNFISTQS